MLFSKSLFDSNERNTIVKAIGDAEALTSGEIRLHIEKKCKSADALIRAQEVFYELGMDKTAAANGVLIYLAYEDKKFAIIGDKGIDTVVPDNFWDSIKEMMAGHFGKGEFIQGVLYAIVETGHQLKQYFPLQEDDKNELTNEISEG